MDDSASFRVELPVASVVREYRVSEVLGSGGFGITYLAWDTNLEKHVALKELMPSGLAIRDGSGNVAAGEGQDQAQLDRARERFMREARTLARFSHPNIVRVNRFFRANGTAYLVMDYERGEPLNRLLKRERRLDPARLRALFERLLDGLAAIHAAGVLHRDIKPHNIIVRESGEPVLLDFGAARQALTGAARPLTAIVSPGYAAPEQYLLDVEQGPWTDIYGLAAVMFRAMTDAHPPDAPLRSEDDPVPAALDGVRSVYPDELIAAVRWGLVLEPRRRPCNVDQWRLALQQGVDSVITAEMRPRATRPELRRGLSAAALGALCMFAAAGVAYALATEPDAPPPEPELPTLVVAHDEQAVTAVPPARTNPPKRTRPPAPKPLTVEVEPPGRLAAEFALTDTNGDGRLQREEVARYPRMSRYFTHADADGDGELSLEEVRRLVHPGR